MKENKKPSKISKFIKRLFILPVMPLLWIYAVVSIILFYKNNTTEFELIIEKDELAEHLKDSAYESFTKSYVIPILNGLAAICWYHIIKFFLYG